ncbi:MAG: hypothetical protein ABSF52_22510 [Syntrophobacteraceae bacterium]
MNSFGLQNCNQERQKGAGSREREAGSGKQGAGSREREAGSRKLGAGSWKREAAKSKKKRWGNFCLKVKRENTGGKMISVRRGALTDVCLRALMYSAARSTPLDPGRLKRTILMEKGGCKESRRSFFCKGSNKFGSLAWSEQVGCL